MEVAGSGCHETDDEGICWALLAQTIHHVLEGLISTDVLWDVVRAVPDRRPNCARN